MAFTSSTSTAPAKAAKLRILSGWVSFSTPSASATSQNPAETIMQACESAVEPLAQAFSTLMIGIFPMPIVSSTTWPRIDS